MALHTINCVVDDEQYAKIVRAKGDLTWRDYLVACAEMRGKAK